MRYFIFVLSLLFIGGAGWYFGSVSNVAEGIRASVVQDDSRLVSGNYPLINETVTSGLGKHYIINMQPLRERLVEIAAEYGYKKHIYFAYLNNDSWIGVNEREYFTAASTIKVPLAMSVMHAVEERKISLDDTYTVQSEDLDDNFGELYKTAEGKTFTIRELMKITLEESDNTASSALFHALQEIGIEDPFSNVYTFMGWDNYPGIGETPEYFDVNLKILSNMFLALYNAKYVDIDSSQEILDYLDNENFNEQIVAGVPDGIPVAHKSGVQTESDSYSDCGIVYAPNRHYLLCIGSEGAPKPVADAFMKEISKTVYDYVINN